MSEARLLIVDDNKQGADILQMLLADEGFDVLKAHTGEDALDLIARRPPDIVILDVMMPGMSGMEVLEKIRLSKDNTELPVIMVTALGDSADVVRGLELGANDYIAKPPQFEVLVARVRTQLKLKQLQDQRRRDLVKLRQLDSVKDKFIQIAAHDLKNPLQNLAVGLTLLEDYEKQLTSDKHYRTILDNLDDAVMTMTSVINDFLDVQAMRAGQVELNPQSVDFNALTKRVLRQFLNYARDKQVMLRPVFDAELPPLQLDPNRIVQVISNLVGNAIKFSEPGTAVDVRTIKTTTSARFEVEDNGPGIPKEEMPLLFQEFARLSNRPTGGEKSSGVGLAISRKLIELHNGEIGAHSERGKGSLFWFELPL